MNEDKNTHHNNNNNYIENLELRIIIVGDEKVGKKTLAKRIQMVNSSDTKNIKYNIQLYNESKEIERKRKIAKFIINHKSSKDENLERFDFRDSETKKHVEYCLINKTLTHFTTQPTPTIAHKWELSL